ncbi:Gliding motility-associated ABC transporter ATP-binding protein GldA [hydrothermal vent metagenome]|uniref:Gliding motility-associated ABC transporter ATP-binding protein GldA n=1 Tax=hydrothermal vent metagenome TaxID=652676 RepID=A0A3B1A710_9ZZZZ
MSNMPLIQVQHLTRHYGNIAAVEKLEFELHKGEILGFLGPNGAGKSTTMNMITGNLAPSSGKITINGIDLLDKPKQAKAQIGYLPEQPPIYKDSTIDEYLTYCTKINRISKKHVTKAIQRTLEQCGLGQVRKRLIANLSKGFQQRIGIAQAIIHLPEIVVLDEPTVGLDPIQITEIRKLIRELGKEHGVLLSTHILPEVQMTCDRVQIINKGKLVFSDSIKNLTHKMDSSAVIIRCKNPPKISELLSLKGVDQCSQINDQSFHIKHALNSDIAEVIIERAVNKGWRLFELRPEQKSLEQVFIEITTNDPSSNTNKSPSNNLETNS